MPEIPTGVATLEDIAEVAEVDIRAPRTLTHEDEEMLNHLSEVAPALARTIRASMKKPSSMSIDSWLQMHTPKTTRDQIAITTDIVAEKLSSKGSNAPKPEDYV